MTFIINYSFQIQKNIYIIIIIIISTTTKHDKICSIKIVLFMFIVQEICQKQIFFPAMNWTRLADDNFK